MLAKCNYFMHLKMYGLIQSQQVSTNPVVVIVVGADMHAINK